MRNKKRFQIIVVVIVIALSSILGTVAQPTQESGRIWQHITQQDK
jgi:hypothetical protein